MPRLTMAEEGRSGSYVDQLRRRNRELSILNSITAALNREVDLTQALNAALSQVAELLELQTGWVWLLDRETEQSYLATAQNLPPGLADKPETMEGDCYCLKSYREGDMKGAANVNVVTCSRLKSLVSGSNDLLYHASIPLYTRTREKLGVLNVASTDWRELTTDDLRLLHTIGDVLGIAIERGHLFEQSSRMGALDERNRLAREIHDTLAQGFAAIALRLESAELSIDAGSDSSTVREAVHRALTLAQANLDEARRSVLDLRAAPLEGRTLIEALAALKGEFEVAGGLEIALESLGAARPLTPRIEAGMYRIAQEALANIVTHAKASKVRIRLVSTPPEVRLEIEDDGIGFEPSEIPKERYGLVGINERAKLLGGAMNLQSSPDVGTRIEIVVPLTTSNTQVSGDLR